MGTRRIFFALVAALVISVGITSAFYVRISRQEGRGHSKMKRIVAATVTLPAGTAVVAEDLTETNWPETVPMEGLIEKKEDVIGRTLVYGVEAKEPILRRDLASNASFGIAAKIPDGMRAIAVKTNEVTNIAGFIFPGSRVDVLVTIRTEHNDAASMTTRTVLQNVQVLSAGTKISPDPRGKPENVNVVTLLVSPEQSEKLALAQNQGTIHFVLRNSGDSANPDTPAVDLAELTGTQNAAKASVPEMARPKRVAAIKPPAPYTVETLAGGKISVATFPAAE
jgi:pilus assembly protein CpaB